MEVKMNISIMDLLPKSVAMGTAMMLSQREKGMEKYGQPIEDADLTALELVEHAAQEAADGLVYISELPAKVQALLDRIKVLEEELGNANFSLLTTRNKLREVLVTQAKLVHALREIVGQCHTRTLGYPGEQVANIYNIAQEALK